MASDKLPETASRPEEGTESQQISRRNALIAACAALLLFCGTYVALAYSDAFTMRYDAVVTEVAEHIDTVTPEPLTLDRDAYDRKLWEIANNGIPFASTTEPYIVTVTNGTTTSTTTAKLPAHVWPVEDAPYPKVGALLPFNRIVAYYGNFYSKGMGALGEYEPDVMLAKLLKEKENWEKADPDTPVIPAIHYIAATAQGSSGEDGMYRFRMPDDQVEHALELAGKVDGIVFLDLQIGLSGLMTEVKAIEPYLKLSQVNLGIDPEFAMKHSGAAPGTVIGTLDAKDINAIAEYLASLVDEYDLPPKILVIHRFTQDMVTHAENIKPLPQVQIVMDMDGWGDPAKKFGTYNRVVAPEPVQFTGFKLFYKNDLKPPSTRLLTPADLLGLTPQPIYIQYQ